MADIIINSDERVDDLQIKGYKIIQNTKMFLQLILLIN